MSSPNSATRALHRLSTRLAPPPDRLVWNGSALVGAARTRAIEVLVPARLLATRSERFPAAAPEALRAAAALRAQRAFAPLGQVVCEALIGAPGRDGCPVLLLALPQAVIAAIRAAAAADRRTLAAIRPAELAQAVPAGGVVHGPGDACLVAFADGFPAALAPLGDPAAPAFAERLARERLRLGADPAAPARPPAGPALDFLHP
ncbi:MAG: hypothetical protein L6R48_13320, partial [Planctomycetes bacterium]|nr:hypothetical protein [Planctomycetota bacterium]